MPALRQLKSAVMPPPGPERLLSLVNLAYAVGRGLFLSGSIVYFTTVTGLSAAQVALGSSAAALSGFAASLLLGMLADRVGARPLLAVLFVVQAAGFALYPAVHSAPAFYVLIVALGFVEYGVGPSFGAFVSSVVDSGERVRVRAVLRTVFNIGFSVGSGLAALALAGGGTAVRALPWVSAVLWLGAALLVTRLPRGRAASGERGRRFGALRDLRFVAVTALSAPLALHASVILVVLPLWTVERTDAPHALIPLLMVANTVFVILFQVAASRGADTVTGAARLARRSGLWLGGACGAAAVAGAVGGAVAASLVLGLAMLLLTVSELQQAASGWGLAHGLAPEDAQGEYLGTFHLHMIVQSVLGPGAVAAATMSWGAWGWAAVAGVILLCAAAVVPVARSAERHRPDTASGSATPSTALAEAA